MAIDAGELTESPPGAPPDDHSVPHVEEDLRAAEAQAAEAEHRLGPIPVRLVIAAAMPTVAAGVMVGGIFEGVEARIGAILAGLGGVGLAVVASRLIRRPLVAYAVIVVGLFAVGLLMMLPDAGDMLDVTARVSEAAAEADLLRPPVPYDPGWHAVVGWIMAIVGFTAVWTAVVVEARSIGLLIPLPIAAVAGISVPDGEQVASGAVVLVLLAIGLGLLSAQNEIGDDDSIHPGVGYELRRAAKALPLLALLVVALVIGKDQLSFLFPDPVIDPAEQPQKPETRPLSDVDDRVLFEVRDAVIGGELVEAPTGPWRTGVLDVYDGEAWRLPPFAASEVQEIDSSGVLDPTRPQVTAASITLLGITGLVLPDLPNSAVIATRGVNIGFDPRSATIRMINGQVPGRLNYIITAAPIPSVADLDAVPDDVPPELGEFLDIPEPPPAVRSLLDQAEVEASGPSRWRRFDWLRSYVLDEVTAEGVGTPVDVPPARVEDMIAGSRKGSPFEMVAAQAMLARWAGVPSRIGFGFDGGQPLEGGDVLAVRPIHGAAWVEVWFGEFGWLPVIGTPRKAEPSVGSDPSLQRFDPNIIPGDEIGATVYVPLIEPPDSVLGEQIALGALGAVPIVLVILAIYFTVPAVRKMILRSRRRSAALAAGTRSRVALAYSELRDYATDLGYRYPTDTPLMFLDRVMDDEEHRELAWMVTRVLWGDLHDDDGPLLASTAEELSRSLRSRLGEAQPATVRFLAVISRLSLRDPYDPRHADAGHRGRSRAWRRAGRRGWRAIPATPDEGME
ncbi:MAG TPA: transglutaminase domain-containing protein [Acidimicrobiales bacterium]